MVRARIRCADRPPPTPAVAVALGAAWLLVRGSVRWRVIAGGAAGYLATGAFEHAPFSVNGTPGLGQTMTFEMWGAPGSTARLLLARMPLVGPVTTPYGTLRLDRPQVVVLLSFSIPAPPCVFARQLPVDPSSVGTTLSFQALTSSIAAPHRWALSNPVSFVIEP